MLSITTITLIGFLLPGIGPHSCVQYTDTGRLELHTEGSPPPHIMTWLIGPQTSQVPKDLAEVLPVLPPCLPGKSHA
jgi:hypothetical protein